MMRERGAGSVRREASARRAAELRRQRVPRQRLGTRILPERFLILVHCAGEAEQLRLLARFEAEGLLCRALIS
jgi:hypothetical protein